MLRRSTREERFAAADAIKERVKRGEITHQEGMYEAARAGERFAMHDNRVTGLWTMICALVIVGLALVAVGVAKAAPAGGALCRYCHPVTCLTSAFCGEGCACLKTDGASTGQCVPR